MAVYTELCLNLNGWSLYFNDITGPDLTRLILVNSGRVKTDFIGIGWLEMIYQWRPQNIVKMEIVIITSAAFKSDSNQSTFGDHLNPIFRLSQIWDMEL